MPSSPVVRPVRICVLAIWSLVLGVIGFCAGIPAVGAVLCGHVGLSRIKRSGGGLSGAGWAIAGLILGYLGLLFWALIIPL